jgi:hypothetical protein
MSRLWRSYLEFLHKHPLKAKVATGVFITGSGDLIGQFVIDGRKELDQKRFLNFCLYGFCVTGCFNHFYFGALDKAFGAELTLKVAAKKILVDMAVLNPAELLGFLAWTHFGTLKKTSFLDKLKQDYLEILIASYWVWFPAQLVNFRLVPIHLRVLFVSCVNVAWYSYGSYISHKAVKPKA